VTRDRVSARVRIAILLAWACVVGAVAIRHEPWRDEVRAYTIATSTATLRDLFGALRTDGDGHPALWYLLLRGAHAVAPVPAVLPAVSLLVAAAAVLLFVVRSPFGPLLTVLFPFSVLPLYEYSVMARNYGVSLLLCFAFAALYRVRRRLLLALCLVLLSNTNAHAAFLTAALALVWCVDELRSGEGLRKIPRAVLPIVAAVSGLLFAAWTAFPGPEVTTHRGMPAAADSLRTLLSASSGSFLAAPFHAPAVLDVAIFLLLAAGFAARPSRVLAATGATLGLYAFFLTVYPGDLRHVGLLLVLVLTLLWIEEERPAPSPPPGPFRRDPDRRARLRSRAASLLRHEPDLPSPRGAVRAVGFLHDEEPGYPLARGDPRRCRARQAGNASRRPASPPAPFRRSGVAEHLEVLVRKENVHEKRRGSRAFPPRSGTDRTVRGHTAIRRAVRRLRAA
jgi:hypothetical protein